MCPVSLLTYASRHFCDKIQLRMFASDEQVALHVGFFNKGSKLTYKKGEFIIRPGETPSSVYYIESGVIKAYNISKYGEENLLIIRKEGEIFPLIWAVTGQEREIIYEALSPATLWRVTREDYLAYLHQHNDALPPLLDMAIEMYRIHSERILNLEYRTVRERLVSFLLTTSNRFGTPTENGGALIKLPLRHQDIASSINATRETTNRELAILSKRGCVKLSAEGIELKDLATLRAML